LGYTIEECDEALARLETDTALSERGREQAKERWTNQRTEAEARAKAKASRDEWASTATPAELAAGVPRL
jgi:hypothetical protein